MAWAHDHCTLECDRRPCHFGHCDRQYLEQEHPELSRVDGKALDAMLASRKDLGSGTFVDGGLLADFCASGGIAWPA